MEFVLGVFMICLSYVAVNGDVFSTVVPIIIEQNTTIKSGLRYGFQQTSDCMNFEKAFLCIQKCLDLNFDVAYADKNCKCTCHIKKEKAKYTVKYNSTRTKWKLGAPTTSIPPWAQDRKKTEKTESDNIIEVNETETTQALIPLGLNDSTIPSDAAKSMATVLGDNANGTPGGEINGAPLVTGIATGSDGTGTESGGAAGTAANAGTGAAADAVTETAAVAVTGAAGDAVTAGGATGVPATPDGGATNAA